MLKVEDGCRNFCTYCIIPFARGPVRSLPISEAVVQTGQLAAEGYQEVVITGIEISSWGQDLDGEKSLMDLLEAVSAAAGEMRLRLGSLEPRTITEDFCRRAAKLMNLCPHFHLSLQSGCDETLRRMNRRYDTERFYKSVTLLREFFPGVAITTDLITGFPGETEEEFQKTLDFIRRCEFAQIHVFPYSVRPGTRAAAMEQLEPQLGMLLFVAGSLFKNRGDLVVAVLLRGGGIVAILRGSLGFAGKCGLEVRFGFGSFEFFHFC